MSFQLFCMCGAIGDGDVARVQQKRSLLEFHLHSVQDILILSCNFIKTPIERQLQAQDCKNWIKVKNLNFKLLEMNVVVYIHWWHVHNTAAFSCICWNWGTGSEAPSENEYILKNKALCKFHVLPSVSVGKKGVVSSWYLISACSYLLV